MADQQTCSRIGFMRRTFTGLHHTSVMRFVTNSVLGNCIYIVLNIFCELENLFAFKCNIKTESHFQNRIDKYPNETISPEIIFTIRKSHFTSETLIQLRRLRQVHGQNRTFFQDVSVQTHVDIMVQQLPECLT